MNVLSNHKPRTQDSTQQKLCADVSERGVFAVMIAGLSLSRCLCVLIIKFAVEPMHIDSLGDPILTMLESTCVSRYHACHVNIGHVEKVEEALLL